MAAQATRAAVVGLLSDLTDRCRAALKTPGSKPEISLYPAFDMFMGDLALALRPSHSVQITSQVGSTGLGVPDWRFDARGELLGWVELKAVRGKTLDTLTGHDQQQVTTFKDGLSNFILSNGWDWRLYRNGKEVGHALLGSPGMFDPDGLPFVPTESAIDDLVLLFEQFFDAPSVDFATAADAVRALATRARAVRSVLESLGSEDAGPHLVGLMNDLKTVLFKNGQVFGWERFIDSYVQLAVFGTLLWRIDTGGEVALDRTVGVDYRLHPLLSSCLQIMWAPQSRPRDLEPLLEELCGTVNLISPELFSRKSGARPYVADPIVHAYEPFFAAYDRASREEAGVYYTPAQVVAQIISGVGHILRHDLGRVDGLRDESTRYIDPATGTGTFLLGLANAVADEAIQEGLPPDQAVLDVITKRTSAFELFPGPYTIAHQRLEAALRGAHGASTIEEPLPIYLCDTLAAPATGQLPSSGFGQAGQALLDERRRSDEVKTTEDILVVFGNPPYERINERKAGPLEDFARNLIELIADATPDEEKVNLKSTKDLYVAFWAWALWALQPPDQRQRTAAKPQIEPSGCTGMVAYITNRKWIIGSSLSGLRRLIRRGATEVYVLDLGGDGRGAHGAKSFAGGDANVFSIRTGVAIVWAVFGEAQGRSAQVHYRRLYGSKAAKLAELAHPFDPTLFEPVNGSDTDGFLPLLWSQPMVGASPLLAELFSDPPALGMQSARDTSRVSPVGTLPEEVYAEQTVATGTRKLGTEVRRVGRLAEWAALRSMAERQTAWTTEQTRRSKQDAPEPRTLDVSKLRRFCYRPLDYRWVYDDPRWIDWYRPEMHEVFRSGAVPTIVTIEREHGAGPACLVTEGLMDQHSFNNRGSRGVFHLWHPAAGSHASEGRVLVGGKRIGYSRRLLGWLSDIGRPDAYEEAFHYLVALLHAPAYTERNWRALEVEGLRVPLSTDPELFDEAANQGRLVSEAWLLRAPRAPGLAWGGDERQGGALGKVRWEAGTLAFENGRQVTGVTSEAWAFQVSGYKVLPRWFEARKHWLVTTVGAKETLHVVSSASTLVDLYARSNDLLERVLAGGLAQEQ